MPAEDAEKLFKILVVDDHPENLSTMQLLLKNIQADVDYVKTGNDALSLMLRHDYAITIIDVQMPEMDGFELVELMRLNPATALVPVIFITAINMSKVNVHHGYEVGAIDYLCKPIDGQILLKKIQFFIDIFHERFILKKTLDNYKLYADVVLGRSHTSTPTKYTDYQHISINDYPDKPKILIVDDIEENIFALKKIISKLNVDIHSTTDPRDAIKRSKKTEYAIILLDVQMPEMNGFDVAKSLKNHEISKDVPIIFVTAISKDDDNVFQGYDSGAVDYLFKPIIPKILLSKIHIFLRLYNQKTILRTIVNEKEKLLDEVKDKNEKLGFLAYHDPLTMLPNRKGFQDAIEQKFMHATRYGRKFAVIQVDIDNFKSINDAYGHQCGDLVLQEVANRIKSSLRKDDFVARLGGDEFVILLEEINSTHSAGSIAQKIIDRFQESFKVLSHEVRVGISAGIACYLGEDGAEDPVDSQILMQYADIAMYKAKHKGRGSYQYYTKEFSEQHQMRVKLEHALRFAIEKNEIFLVYQPKICLRTGCISGVEVLVRWQHAEYGIIAPDVFIPLAEETHLIMHIGSWIIEKACKQLRDWLDAGYMDAKIAINLSPVQLLNKKFEEHLFATIDKYSLPSEKLEFELTETVIMEKNQEVLNRLNELCKAGLIITIDDFGTGYSMLSYLKTLPVSCLKIDMEFVQHVDKSRSDAMIVKSIIDLAKNFNLKVVAEGVEKKSHVDFLIENDCDFGQGYYFCKPLPAADIEQFMQNKK